MRQVFTSQRLETVEGVARLLRDEGIEVHISNRSYGQRRAGLFSYADPTPQKQQPAVWVRNADDQPRARALLREAGLLETTRPDAERPATATLTFQSPYTLESGRTRWAWRVRLILLALATVAAVLIWLHRQGASTAPPTGTSPMPAATRPTHDNDDAIRVRLTPPTAPRPGEHATPPNP